MPQFDFYRSYIVTMLLPAIAIILCTLMWCVCCTSLTSCGAHLT